MGFFSKIFGVSKDFVPSIDFSKYSQIGSLASLELSKYTRLRQMINSCLADFNSFYKKEFGKDAEKKHYLEVLSFIWSAAQNIFQRKGLSQKTGFALYYSIREEFTSLTKELNDSNYKEFDGFFQSRSGFYKRDDEKL